MSDGRFATARTRKFKERELSEFNRSEIETIEEFGCQVLHVAASGDGTLSFTYTFGLFDTCGLPELIEVGLPYETARDLLDEAIQLLRAGTLLGEGRHKGLLNGVECEFRSVDPKWARQLMLGANWFYEGSEYPVLQAVYPDLANRFPEDADFDPHFAQPLLQSARAFGRIEEHFWKAQEL